MKNLFEFNRRQVFHIKLSLPACKRAWTHISTYLKDIENEKTIDMLAFSVDSAVGEQTHANVIVDLINEWSRRKL